MNAVTTSVTVKDIGCQDYVETWQAMKRFTQGRGTDTADEIWIVEHPPVFTQGQAGKPEHILNAKDIPVVDSDRGGQVTYHGPGQLVMYLLFDLKRRGIGVRGLVNGIEQAVLDTLASYGIQAQRRKNAPGIYVAEAKICSLGLRIRKGCSYHGLALNVDMDLTPFSLINPCGFAGMAVTQCRDLIPNITMAEIRERLLAHIQCQ